MATKLLRITAWTCGGILLVLLLLFLATFLVDEPLRRHMEAQINNRLDGYGVKVGELDLHPLGASVTLEDVVIRQSAYPDPPVAGIPRLTASVHWRALLSGRLVAVFEFLEPKVHIDLRQLRAETRSEVPVEQRGWQQAARAIYPLKINLLVVSQGDLTYIDEDPQRPLRIDRIDLEARNIRNVESPEGSYPSPFLFQGRVFRQGQASLSGKADFLAEPHIGFSAELNLDAIALEYFQPVLARYNFYVSEGALSATGEIEYAPAVRKLHLNQVIVEHLALDYVHSQATEAQEEKRLARAREAGEEAANAPGLLLRVDDLRLAGRFGMVNDSAEPAYRVFLDPMELHLANLSNQFREGEAKAKLTGKFMGSGTSSATATFRPEIDGPDFDLDVSIEGTALRSMNDLLRAYGNFDVVAGEFSLFSEIRVKNDRIDGYVKPLFQDVEVHDLRQDEEKDLFQQMYEGLVGGIAGLLENEPREEVATVTELSGKVDNPEADTWQVILRLVQNAFLQAILPGFEREISPSEQ